MIRDLTLVFSVSHALIESRDVWKEIEIESENDDWGVSGSGNESANESENASGDVTTENCLASSAKSIPEHQTSHDRTRKESTHS